MLVRNNAHTIAGHLFEHTTPGRGYPAIKVKIGGVINHEITDDIGEKIIVSNNARRAFFRRKT